jgi:hypothetical protein
MCSGLAYVFVVLTPVCFCAEGKGKLSEAETQVKRAEAARRRKQQVEKAAIEIQATAIQKILGQDSTRKRREDRLHKQRQEIEQVSFGCIDT